MSDEPNPGVTVPDDLAELDAGSRSPHEFAEELCARDTLAARTRMTLLAAEKRHHRAGWDAPENMPSIFQVFYKPETGAVKYHKCHKYTELIRILMDHNGGNGGGAVRWFARYLEKFQAGEMDDSLSPDVRESLRVFRHPPGEDVYGGGAGLRFYGFGMSSEAWMTVGDYAANHDLARQGRLNEAPGRKEVRWFTFAPRDGLLWWITRVRGEQPTVQVLPPESDASLGGNIPHALARLTNVIAGVPRPIPEQDPIPGDRETS